MLILTRKTAGTKPWASVSPSQEEPNFRMPTTEDEDETAVRARKV